MKFFDKSRWSRLSTVIFVGYVALTFIIAVETYFLKLSILGLSIALPTVFGLYLLVQIQPRRLPIQFASSQTEERKRFAVAFLMGHHRLLSRLMSENKTHDYESNLTEAIDAIIKSEKLQIDDDLRQELISTCLLNRNYVSKRVGFNSPRAWIIVPIALIANVGLQMHNGDTFLTALSVTMITLIICIPVLYLVFWRFLMPKMIKEQRELIERTIRDDK